MQIDEVKLDYFLLWANALKDEDKIIEIIEKKFEIKRIVRRKYLLLFFLDAFRIYKFSFVPFYYLIKKLFYLRKSPKEMLFVFVKNKNPEFTHMWNGVFRTIYCKKIHNTKKLIRDKFQKSNSEEHIIHSGDTYFDYKIAKKISRDKEIKYNFENLKKIKIELKNLYCINFYGHRWNPKIKIIPLKESYQYKYLTGDQESYNEYINKFRGTFLKDFYSIKKFRLLFSIISQNDNLCDKIVVKKINSKYVVLDGTHRSSICLYLKKDIKEFYLYE